MIFSKTDPRNLILANEKLAVRIHQLLQDERSLTKSLRELHRAKAYKLYLFVSKVNKFLRKKLFFNKNLSDNVIKTEQKVPQISKVITELVSIVIPTRNGGPDFEKNLAAILDQKNIPNKEVLILDNNSTDGTRELAIKKGCRVFLIKDNEFGHGKTRAFGANEALGKYIIFTVQDAHIKDKHTYSKLINFTKDNELWAASGCQLPKEDADSFASWQNSYHYNVMNPKNGSIIYDASNISVPEYMKLDFLSKRKMICIDDVIACYKREVFEKYNFSESVNFAEDAYLAQLILLDGKRIGLTHSSLVHHSHNVGPIYAFKRSYVDNISLKKIFNQDLNRITGNHSDLKSQLITIFLFASTLGDSNYKSISFSEVKKKLSEKINPSNPMIKATFKLFPKIKLSNYQPNYNLIKNILHNISSILTEYSNYCKTINKPVLYDKLIASVLGSYLAEITINFRNNLFIHKVENSLNQRV